ncbi:MAG: hypothetical protein ACJA1N_001813 [Saprospiraceae bacterium]
MLLLYFKKGQNDNQMNRKLPFWSITVGLGGFLSGFDRTSIFGAKKSI